MRSTHPRKRQRLVVMHGTTATIRPRHTSRNFAAIKKFLTRKLKISQILSVSRNFCASKIWSYMVFQERKMLWVCGVISHHIPPGHTHCHAQSYTHTFSIRSCAQSVLTELLICRSNCSYFSSWIQVSIIALNRFLGRRMIVCARVSQKRQKSSPKIHTYANDFCFLLCITALPIL